MANGSLAESYGVAIVFALGRFRIGKIQGAVFDIPEAALKTEARVEK